MSEAAIVSRRGALRWERGHPWIFRSDVITRPDSPAGAVRVRERSGRVLGWALWSPQSEISLRLLEPEGEARIDADWWGQRLERVLSRRAGLERVATGHRLVHGEGDGCPSLICDRYDQWLVVQLLSAGIERYREEIVTALRKLTGASGVLARNDVPVRAREGLPVTVELLHGDVPKAVEIMEHGVRYEAAPWDGQKTGAFLDQRENRARVGALTRGRALDCFAYHGSFALHLAARATHVTAVDSSAPALERAEANAARNGLTNLKLVEANVFEHLRACEQRGDRFDTIVLDPPAFAKSRSAIPAALRGYKEINLRAMRLLEPGGILFSASCSYHLTKPLFLEMLTDAAADSGRTMVLRDLTGQPLDHPELLGVPETGYLKGAILEAQQ